MRQLACLLTWAPCLRVRHHIGLSLSFEYPVFPTECSSDSRLHDLIITIITIMDWSCIALFKDFASLQAEERSDFIHCKFSSAGSLIKCHCLIIIFYLIFFAWSVKSIRTALPVCFIFIFVFFFCLFMAVFLSLLSLPFLSLISNKINAIILWIPQDSFGEKKTIKHLKIK